MSLKEQRSLIVDWNNTFPLDRWWRMKYNVPFNSEVHCKANQIDIYLEWLEEQVYTEYFEEQRVDRENQELFGKGIWIKESIILNEEEASLFDKLDIRQFNQESSLQIEEDDETNG